MDPVGRDDQYARAVSEASGRPGELADLANAIEAAVGSAWAAWVERPDLFEDPGNSRVLAEVATSAVVAWARRRVGSEDADGLPPPQVLAADTAKLAYKDWKFSLVQLPDGTPAVKVTAALDDSFHAGAPFRTAQVAAIVDGVPQAALRAIVQIETHEAEERLRSGGKAIFDPHGADRLPAPTNTRQEAVEPLRPT